MPARAQTSKTGDSENVEIQALGVAMNILELLSNQYDRLSAAEIARRLKMTPTRVWRHLNSMQALGLVNEGGGDGKRGFVLGGRLVHLGQRAADQINVVEVAYYPARELRDVSRESVYLTIPHGDGGTVILSLNGLSSISLHLNVGSFFPGHASAAGRTLMAFSSKERIRQFLTSELREDFGHTPIAVAAELERRFELIRARYFDTAQTEGAVRVTGTVFVNAIAAPIFDHRGDIVATIGLLTGIRGEDAISDPAIKTPLFRCAAKISKLLGSSSWETSGWAPDES